MAIITGTGGAGALTPGSVAISSLADPTTGKVIGSAAGAAAAVFPPGFEVGYDQITVGVNVASTTEATGTTIITCAAHTFDGAPVLAHFFSPAVTPPTGSVGNAVTICLFEAATQIGRLVNLPTYQTTSAGSQIALSGFLRFTPTAAAHTYTVTAFASSLTGTPAIGAGASGTGAFVPAFIRFTKV